MKLFGRTLAILAISAAALFTASGLALAHPGAAALDADKMVTVKGAVTELVYMNPHVQVYWETNNEQGVSENGANADPCYCSHMAGVGDVHIRAGTGFFCGIRCGRSAKA